MRPEHDLFSPAPFDPATATLSKSGFAELIGVSKSRVSQLITAGLPVEPNGRIHVARGRDWVERNVDPNRRRSASPASMPVDSPAGLVGGFLTPKAKRDAAEAEIAGLKASRLAQRHLDRKATERVIEARARAERDALIGWVNRAAPAIAAGTGADLQAITAILDREVRDHLVTLAAMTLELPR